MENQDLSKVLGLQESVTLADGNKYMLSELTVGDLADITRTVKADENTFDYLIEQLLRMAKKENPDMTRDKIKNLVTASMLNPKSSNSILPVINQLSGKFGEVESPNV